MKLRNKKTWEVIEVGDYGVGIEYGQHTHYYSTIAEFIEEWEDYKPAEPRRYRLIKDLPTFKAGEIFVLENAIEHKGLFRDSDGIMAYHQKTLEKFPNILTDWFEPVERDLEKTRPTGEPLIKDELARKAIRAWAEANDIERVWHEYSSNWLRGNGLMIELENEVVELAQGNYSIAELCGEEKE